MLRTVLTLNCAPDLELDLEPRISVRRSRHPASLNGRSQLLTRLDMLLVAMCLTKWDFWLWGNLKNFCVGSAWRKTQLQEQHTLAMRKSMTSIMAERT